MVKFKTGRLGLLWIMLISPIYEKNNFVFALEECNIKLVELEKQKTTSFIFLLESKIRAFCNS